MGLAKMSCQATFQLLMGRGNNSTCHKASIIYSIA